MFAARDATGDERTERDGVESDGWEPYADLRGRRHGLERRSSAFKRTNGEPASTVFSASSIPGTVMSTILPIVRISIAPRLSKRWTACSSDCPHPSTTTTTPETRLLDSSASTISFRGSATISYSYVPASPSEKQKPGPPQVRPGSQEPVCM